MSVVSLFCGFNLITVLQDSIPAMGEMWCKAVNVTILIITISAGLSNESHSSLKDDA
jgi:hypothetical protein